jgi:hypothetical protein
MYHHVAVCIYLQTMILIIKLSIILLDSFFMLTMPHHSTKMEILKGIEMNTTMMIQTSVILFWLNQASVLMITIMLTDSLTITKKHKDNKVRSHLSYRSNSII